MNIVTELAAAGGRGVASGVAAAAIAIALMSGCTSVTFKPGATPTTMASDESICHKAHPGASAFRTCMREKGWFVAGSSSDSGADPAGAPMSDRAGTQASPLAKVIDFNAPPATDTRPVNPATTPEGPAMPTQSQAPATSSVATTATPRQRPSSAAAVVSAPSSASGAPAGADEAALIGVASWWKLGGTPGGLDGDVAACATKLGDVHRPAPAATRVTRAMGACLRERGWYAIGRSR